MSRILNTESRDKGDDLLAEGCDDALLYEEGDLGLVAGDGEVGDGPRRLFLRLELAPARITGFISRTVPAVTRIRIGSGSRRAKMTHKNRKKFRINVWKCWMFSFCVWNSTLQE
jgi:hypothetical protein